MTAELGKTLSPKVVAGTAGAGAGAIVTTAATWALGAGVFGGGWDASQVEAAVAAVPTPLTALLALGIGVAFTFVPAWWIRDHVREEGAAAIAAAPTVVEELEVVTAKANSVEHADGHGHPELDGPEPPADVSDLSMEDQGYTGARGK